MKNCNNCGAANALTASRCTHCNMEGHFTFQVLTENKINKKGHECHNCGHEDLINSDNCLECNFPLPIRENIETPITNLSSRNGLKAAN